MAPLGVTVLSLTVPPGRSGPVGESGDTCSEDLMPRDGRLHPAGSVLVDREAADPQRPSRGGLADRGHAVTALVGVRAADGQVENDLVAVVDRLVPGRRADLALGDVEELVPVDVPADLLIGGFPPVHGAAVPVITGLG